MKRAMKPSAYSIGVSKMRLPRQVVASQLKILIPVGTAITIDEIMKNESSPMRQPDREHVVRPDEHREEGDAERRERDRLVAEDRLAREDRQDLRDHPHRGQHHDVDLGVPEEPEDVLVEDDVAALRRDEEVRAGLAVEQQQRQPAPRAPAARATSRTAYVSIDQTKSGIRIHVMPARAHVVDRDEEVDRAGERRDREDVQAEDPVVLAVPGRRTSPPRAACTPSSRPWPRRRSRTSSARGRCRRAGTSQYENAFRRGKAMSRAPIISGTRKLPKPAMIGTTTRKIIAVPCIVMTWS